MRGELGNKQRLLHILDAISNVEEFVKDLNEEEFSKSKLIQSAIIFPLIIIGEASGQLTVELKERYNEIPWHRIKGFRNMAAHEYWGIDFKEVWETISDDLPVFKQQVQQILEEQK